MPGAVVNVNLTWKAWLSLKQIQHFLKIRPIYEIKKQQNTNESSTSIGVAQSHFI